MDVVRDFIELVKEHGAGTASMLAAFALVAWIVGAGGKLAIENIRGLLDTSASLREAMAKQLGDERDRTTELTAQLADTGVQLETTKKLLTEAVEGFRTARNDLAVLSARHDVLREQYDTLNAIHNDLQARMRDTLLAQHIARPAGETP